MPERILMLVLNYTPFTDPAHALMVAERALRGGVNWLMLRVREMPAQMALEMALQLRRLTHEAKALLGINPYPALAVWCNADAIHLPEHAPPYTPTPPMLLGRSVHSVAAAQHAVAEGCHYLLVGTIYPTSSHPNKVPEGLLLLRAVREAVSLPLIAIGGITPERVRECLEAGAQGVAVVSGIAEAADPEAAARHYWHALREYA
ncbi:MAG: thiamine phosphate synthase [Armatimonadota bacterium]|nr:thiamine phosphate synthase [Armatimonadota bacterium]